jgi:nucleotide-binding universal stress UspA family protein
MYRKILVPLDGSELAECSLEHVRAIASGCNVPDVVLLTVLEPVSGVTGLTARMPDEWLRNVEKEQKTGIENYLAKVAAWLKKAGLTVTAVTLRGNAADEILDYAAKNNVDLIVICTHGRTGIARWAFGSVADRVVRHSHIPVLIVSPHDFRASK